MTEVVKQRKGSVIQFVGDEIFAAFGTPEIHADNEANVDSIMISDSVYQKVKDSSNLKAWDPLLVKGKKDKILVYEVPGIK
jgi:class 3 adenylate cyclase